MKPQHEMTCKEIYQDHRRELAYVYEVYRQRMNAAAERDFPDGTPVSWTIPGHKKPVCGIVTGRVIGETASIMVRSEGGMGNTVHAWELTKINCDERS